jgi:murein DD-endopeptidase MepM/ murein hydrolase activator NlpD
MRRSPPPPAPRSRLTAVRHPSGASIRWAIVGALVVSASLVGGVAPGPARATHGDATPRAVWSWPVAPPHPVVRPFSAPEHAWSPGHRGIDIGAAPGTTVTAPDDGVVRFSGTVVDRPVLSITHADGVISSLEPVTSDLSAGEAVSRGATVGVVVAGHSSDADAVHLGARLDGEYVSPLLMLGGGRPSVLLPTRQID